MANDKTDPAVQQVLLNISKQLETSLDKRLEDQKLLNENYRKALAAMNLTIEAQEEGIRKQELKNQQ